MRIDRMLAIVVILLNHRRITAKALADRFEVSLRTIYRDIDAINLAGIPVISNQGAHGGYEIPESYKLSKQLMGQKDLRSIASALKGMNVALGDRQIDLVLEKVESLLPGSHPPGNETIVFDTMDWGRDDAISKRIQLLYEAIKVRRCIDMTYTNMKGEPSQRQVHPQSIVQKGFAWYLYGFCCKKKAMRMFKLRRIKQLEVLDRVFDRWGDPYEIKPGVWEEASKRTDSILRFKKQIRYVVDEYFTAYELISESPDDVVIRVDLPQDQWMVGMLLSYGPAVEVIKPLALRDEIKKQVQQLSEMYKK